MYSLVQKDNCGDIINYTVIYPILVNEYLLFNTSIYNNTQYISIQVENSNGNYTTNLTAISKTLYYLLILHFN